MGTGGTQTVKRSEKHQYKKVRQNLPKTNFFCVAILHPLLVKVFKSETTSFITFPQEFLISKNFGPPTLGNGDKKMFKRYLKSEQTDRRTDRRTRGRTFRLIERIGPEGRCFQNGNKNKPAAQAADADPSPLKLH